MEKLAEGFGGFEGFEGFEGGQTKALNALKNRWPWWLAAKRCKGPAWRVALQRLAEGFGGFGGFEGFEKFEGGQTVALNALKNRWPWCLAAKRCKGPAWRVALERLAEGLEGLEGLKGLRGLRAGKRQP